MDSGGMAGSLVDAQLRVTLPGVSPVMSTRFLTAGAPAQRVRHQWNAQVFAAAELPQS